MSTDALIAEIVEAMTEHGFAVHVATDENDLRYAYTIGRHLRGHAELIVSAALPPLALRQILTRICRWEDDTERDLNHFLGVVNPIEDVIHVPFHVEQTQDPPATFAQQFYPDADVLQIVLPDSIRQHLWTVTVL